MRGSECCIKGDEEGPANERSACTKEHRSIANSLQHPSSPSNSEHREKSKRTCADQNEPTKEHTHIHKVRAFGGAQEHLAAQLRIKGAAEEKIANKLIREAARNLWLNAEKGRSVSKVKQRMNDGREKEEQHREGEQRKQYPNGQQRSPRYVAQRVHASTRTRPCSHHDFTESGSGATRPSSTAARVTAAWKSPHSLSAST
jgi:hypothetical protein